MSRQESRKEAETAQTRPLRARCGLYSINRFIYAKSAGKPSFWAMSGGQLNCREFQAVAADVAWMKRQRFLVFLLRGVTPVSRQDIHPLDHSFRCARRQLLRFSSAHMAYFRATWPHPRPATAATSSMAFTKGSHSSNLRLGPSSTFNGAGPSVQANWLRKVSKLVFLEWEVLEDECSLQDKLLDVAWSFPANAIMPFAALRSRQGTAFPTAGRPCRQRASGRAKGRFAAEAKCASATEGEACRACKAEVGGDDLGIRQNLGRAV